jgi:hypothetical protein
MSREIRRVPLDFDFPIGDTWTGYLLPGELHERKCPDCRIGTTPGREWLSALVRMILMLDDDLRDQQLGRPLHPYLAELQNVYTDQRPTSDVKALATGLAGREAGFHGHDACDTWAAERAIVTAAGLDSDTWGICPTCDGHASVETYPGQRADAEKWEPTEPPTGYGWQVWQTGSEGGPCSPVFATRADLVNYHASPANAATMVVLTHEQAEAFVSEGASVGSGVFTADGQYIDGAAAVYEMRRGSK